MSGKREFRVSTYADLIDVLYEDNHLLGLNKPAGWPTTHFEGSEETVDRLAKAYLKEKYQKPGNVFLGVVHRLDKPTSGALVFARTSKAASRLSEQFRDGAVEKVYWAVVEENRRSDPPGDEPLWGTFEDWVLHRDDEKRVEVVAPHTPDAKLARTHYQVKARHGGLMLLELRPQTGRKHQLRVQLANRGCPVYADAKYGGKQLFGHAIGLHARSLSFLHPTKNELITLTADVPKPWRGRFAYLLA
jgi:23S rRNA pseudouridine1911/1915/1917 synthase